jgi:hypothetical protein
MTEPTGIALASAVGQGLGIAAEDLHSSGGSLSLVEVSRLSSVHPDHVGTMAASGRLLVLPSAGQPDRYPAAQFLEDGTVVPGLAEVLKALQTPNPWTVLNFLVTGDHRLDGRRPIDVLKAGDTEIVVEAARRMGEQGA